jgi:hypothetical protein
MRTPLTYLLVGIIMACGYWGLWLAKPSMTGDDAASWLQHAAIENMLSKMGRTAQERSANRPAAANENVASREANDAERKPLRTPEDVRSSPTIGENGNGRRKVRQTSRTLHDLHRQGHFEELLTNPLRCRASARSNALRPRRLCASSIDT